MNKLCAIVLSLMLAGCGFRGGSVSSSERHDSSSNPLSQVWQEQCPNKGDCLGARVKTPYGIYTVVTPESMPLFRPNLDEATHRVTEEIVMLWLFNQESARAGTFIAGFEFPDEQRIASHEE